MKNFKFQISNFKLKKIKNLQSAICNFPSPHPSPRWGEGKGEGGGFTLVELMIAIVITALATAAVYTTFIVQQRSFVVQDQVSETQVASNIAFNTLVNRIRGAGFGYPITETPDINGITGLIGVEDAGTDSSPDSITIVGGFRALGTIGLPAGQSTTQIEQKDGGVDYLDICYDSSTEFNDDDMRYLSVDGIFYAEVISTDDGAATANCSAGETRSRLYINRPVPIEFPVDRPIYLIEDVLFTISGSDLQIIDRSPPPSTLASNIDDIQFTYAIDTNDDGEIDDRNGNGTVDPGDYINPPLPANAEVLAVRANLLASTANPDSTLDPATKPYAAGITLENGSTIGAGDNIRRRIWSTEIVIRNPR